MNIILIGPPGVGKGTQAEQICETYSLVHLSSGDILRKAIRKSRDTGGDLARLLASGQLVDDDTVCQLVLSAIKQAESNCVLDGFPRTAAQARFIKQQGIHVDLVIELKVDDEVVVERIAGRMVHPSSGRVYHARFNPPIREGLDDVTGQPLVVRPDDKESVVRERLSVYHREAESLLSFYKQPCSSVSRVVTVDASASIDEVFTRIKALI